jgi:DNA-binding CsgD family transcriptional regulator
MNAGERCTVDAAHESDVAAEQQHIDDAIAALVDATRSRPALAAHGNPDADVVIELVVDRVRYRLSLSRLDHGKGTLSPREQEIARLIASGHTNKTVAAVLGISIWTVSTHIRRIFSKLDVTTRAAMVAKLTTGAAQADGVVFPSDATPAPGLALDLGRSATA